MDNKIDSSRIIGSCLEINSDIISMRFNSKLPDFIAKIQEKYYRKKLIKTVKKLSDANFPLRTDNLLELFNYIFSNYPPYGSYKNIKQCKYVTDNTSAKVILNDEVTGYFRIYDNSNVFSLLLVIKNLDGSTRSYNLDLEELISSNPEIKDEVRELNTVLIDIMMNYILDTIEIYILEKKE